MNKFDDIYQSIKDSSDFEEEEIAEETDYYELLKTFTDLSPEKFEIEMNNLISVIKNNYVTLANIGEAIHRFPKKYPQYKECCTEIYKEIVDYGSNNYTGRKLDYFTKHIKGIKIETDISILESKNVIQAFKNIFGDNLLSEYKKLQINNKSDMDDKTALYNIEKLSKLLNKKVSSISITVHYRK